MSSSIERFLQETGGLQTPQAPLQPGLDSSVADWHKGSDTSSRLGVAVGAGDPKEVDKATRVLQLQGKTGLPQDIIENNLDEIEKQARRADFDPQKFQQTSPIVAKWLAEDPKHVILASPDLLKLSWLERQVQNIKDQFRQGAATTEMWKIGESAMKGTITPAERKRQAELEGGIMTKSPADLGITGFFEGIPGAIANQIPIFGATLEGKTEYAAKGAAHGAALGAITGAVAGAPEAGVGAIPGAIAGAAAGSAAMGAAGYHWGAAIAAGRMEASLAYLEYEKVRDANGHPLDRDTMLGAAAITGVLNGALEMVGFESVAKTVPGLRMLERGELKRALASQTVSGAIRRMAKGVGEAMVTEGATEFMQDVVKNGAQEIATMIQDGSIKTASTTQILARIFSQQHMAEAIQDAKAGAQAGGGMAAAGGSVSAMADVHRARTAQRTQQFFTSLSAATTDSQIMDKLPAKMQEVVSRLTQDGPVQNIYAPIETWNEYWQGKNLDPVQAAREVTGSDAAYTEAQRTGGDLVIPTERYATTIAPSEHHAFFQNEIRLDPMAMNQREASELGKRMAEEEAARPAPTEDTSPKIGEKVLEQLTQAGFDEKTAKNYADLWTSTFKALGERTGIDPQKLFERYNANISRVTDDVNGSQRWVEMNQDKLNKDDVEYLNTPQGQMELAQRLTATMTKADVWAMIDQHVNAAHDKQTAAEQAAEAGNKSRAAQIVDKVVQQTFEQGANPDNAYEAAIRKLWAEQGATGRLNLLAEFKRMWPDEQFLPGWANLQLEDLPQHVQNKLGYERARQVAEMARVMQSPPKGDNFGFWQSPLTGAQIRDGRKVNSLPPGFYSKAESLIETKMPSQATVDDIKGIMKDVKEDERKWLGLDDMIKQWEEEFRSEKLSKDYVLSWLRLNRLKIEEVAALGTIDEEMVQRMVSERAERQVRRELDQGSWLFNEYTSEEASKLFGGKREGGMYAIPTARHPRYASHNYEGTFLGPFEHEGYARSAVIEYEIEGFIDDTDLVSVWMEEARDQLREDGEGGQFEDYTLPGGDKYREIRFFSKRLGDFQSTHWPEGGVFAHARVKSRVLADGSKMLFIEEIQSDLHEQGRKHGYLTPETRIIKIQREQLKKRIAITDRQIREIDGKIALGIGVTQAEEAKAEVLQTDWIRYRAELDALPLVTDKVVPDAPFKKTWHEFVVKRMLRMAAEEGFDHIGWTTGSWAAYHFGLARAVESIAWNLESVGEAVAGKPASYIVRLVPKAKGQHYVGAGNYTKEMLGDAIGKDLAAKIDDIVQHEIQRHAELGEDIEQVGISGVFTGEDLELGGHGMKGFYDGMIPQFMKSFVKKYGAEVKDVDMPLTETLDDASDGGPYQAGVAIMNELRDFYGMNNDIKGKGLVREIPTGKEEGQQTVPITTIHGVTLTPELKKAALANEFTLYQTDPQIHVDALNEIQGYLAEIRDIVIGLAEDERKGELDDDPELLVDLQKHQKKVIKLATAVKNHDQATTLRLLGDLMQDSGDEPEDQLHNNIPSVFLWANTFQQGARGRIRFSDNGVNIELLKAADLSTFLHETGHFYLHVMQDLAGSNESVAADLMTIRKWLGAEGEGPLTRDQHELFARGFEAYLAEGRAPVPALRAAFSRFKAWLTTIYKSLTALNVQLTPEVKTVFDRLVASQDEITTAEQQATREPLFADPEAAGMTKEQATDYRESVTASRAKAEEELLNKLTDEVKREQNRQYRIQRDQIRSQVSQEVNQDKTQLALAALSRGTMPDGMPLPEHLQKLKLDRQAIIDMYGGDKGVLASLPRPYIYAKEGGIHPDKAAELFGFSSGEQLLKALPGPGQESPSQRIERLTDERMRAQNGDMLTDGRLPAEAMKAVHNVDRAQLLRKELQHLARNDLPTLKGLLRKIQRRVPTIESVRLEAESIIDGKRVRDILPSQFQHAETKAAKAALEAFLKGDIELAFEEKQRELFNHELFRAATNARDNIDRIVDYMGRFNVANKREQLKKAGGSYLAQIDAIRDRFDFRRSVTNKELANRESLIDFVNQHAALGLPTTVPTSVLNEAYREHYKNMSFRELQDLRDVVKQIDHLARLKNELVQLQKQRSFNATKADIVGSITANHDLKGEPLDFNPNFKKRFIAGMKRVIASHTKMEFLFEWLDGNKDNGPVWSALFKPMADAEGAEETMMRAATTNLKSIFSEYSTAERADWFWKRMHVDGFETSFTKANLLAVALNWGNQYNREALMEGYHWNEAQVQRLLDKLDARDWGVVQNIWNYLDSFWPAIAKQEADLNGLPPEKVQADEVITKHGTFRGGYYPIVFDAKLSWRQSVLNSREEAKELFGGRWSRAMTKHGHTEERTNTGGKPLKLDLTALTEHVSNVVHDLTHRRAIIDVARLTQDREVRVAIEKSVGREMYKQIHPWLLNIAGARRGDYVNPIEGILGRARSGATIVSMGWKMTTAITQFLSYTNTVKELGINYASKGVADVYAKPWQLKQTWQFITERSEFMHSRLSNYDRDVHDAMKRLNVAGVNAGPMSVFTPYTTELRDSWFSMIGWMDMGASMPTWLGAYRKAMDGAVENIAKGEEQAAVDYADKVVRQTQGVGAAKDLALVQQGNEAFKLFTMFYSYFNVLFNQFAKTQHQFTIDKNVPKMIGALAMLWFLPAALQDMIVGRAPDPDADKEEWIKWLLKVETQYPFMSVILLRDIINGMGHFDYQPSAALDAFTQLTKAGKGIVGRVAGDAEELTPAQVKSIVMTVGYFAHLPTRQMYLTGAYLHDWWTGELGEDFNPWHALVTGSPKE
jgi:hypothetical protein